MTKTVYTKAKFFYFLVLIFTVYICYSVYEICDYSHFHSDQSADAAIVLGASIDQDQPSPVFQARINHAIALFKQNNVRAIIFTGGISHNKQYAESEVAKAYAVTKGIPASALHTEQVSTITYENLAQAKIIMQENGLTSALIVSDPLHMKRAMVMAKDLGLNVMSAPTPTSMYRSWQTKLPFLAREVYFYIGYQIVRLLGLEINQ